MSMRQSRDRLFSVPRPRHYLQARPDLVRYRRVFDQLRAMAVAPKDSAARMAAIAKSFVED